MSELKKLILIASAAEGGVTKPQIRMFIKSCTRMRSNAMILQSFLRGEIILSRFVKGDFLMKAVPKDDQEKWRKMLDAAGAGEKAEEYFTVE